MRRILHELVDDGTITAIGKKQSRLRTYTRAQTTSLYSLYRLPSRVGWSRPIDSQCRSIRTLTAHSADVSPMMREQRTRISEHITQLQLILQDIDELSAYAHNTKEDETMDNPYANEAHDRWGDSPQWMEYAEYRTRTDDAQQQADLDAMRALELELAQAMRDGVKPGSEAADELALRHRESLTWYHVTPSMHVCLAKMYVNDPRFRAHYDSIEPGLAAWLHDVIAAQVATEGVDAEHARWE